MARGAPGRRGVSDTLVALLLSWGPALLAGVTFLSCLALPLPASLMMMAAGAFSAGGDLALPAVGGAALAGAVVGDVAGYATGRVGARLLGRLTGPRAGLLERARDFTLRRGAASVFLSRWLFSPLGPYVNFVAGAAVWVALCVGAGYLFADRIEALSSMAGSLSGALAAGAVTVGLGAALWHVARRRGRQGVRRT
jgi:membrane-associated protein